ncbi:MAG: hypothetical protein AMXMBFR82_47680 [Candidatus Hydrogenedentota bacterium]
MKTEPKIPSGAKSALRVAALTGILSPHAWANAGTPLMLLTFAHLMFGNAIIGLAEGLLLWLMFRKSARLIVVPLMIAANYLSAWVGYAFVVGVREFGIVGGQLPTDPQHALSVLPDTLHTAFWIVAAVTFAMSVVLEWPFVAFALKPRPRRALVALGISLLLQTASYALIAPLYGTAAKVNLLEETVDAAVVAGSANNAWIYYISQVGATLNQIRINGSDRGIVATLPVVEGEHRWLRPVAAEGDETIALAYRTSADENHVAISDWCKRSHHPWKIFPNPQGDYPPEWETPWHASTSDLIHRGLAVYNSDQHEARNLFLDTPLLDWECVNATLLPDHRVVFQLGPWIVLYEIDSRRIGVIAEGHSPVLVLDESTTTDATTASDVSVEGPSESANGFAAYTVNSPYQARSTEIEVLPPDVMVPGETYPVLYLLPVNDGIMNQWGSGIVEARKHDLANRFKVICVSPEYDYTPWYGNHPSDPALQQETYLLEVVMPVIEARYPVVPGRDGRILLGFSKSGFGAIAIALRNLDRIGKAAAWDAPLMMTSPFPNEEEMMRVFVSQENFDPFCVPALVEKHAAALRAGPSRFVLVSNGSETGSVPDLHGLLENYGIPHRFLIDQRREHTWTSDWLPVVAELLFALDNT